LVLAFSFKVNGLTSEEDFEGLDDEFCSCFDEFCSCFQVNGLTSDEDYDEFYATMDLNMIDDISSRILNDMDLAITRNEQDIKKYNKMFNKFEFPEQFTNDDIFVCFQTLLLDHQLLFVRLATLNRVMYQISQIELNPTKHWPQWRNKIQKYIQLNGEAEEARKKFRNYGNDTCKHTSPESPVMAWSYDEENQNLKIIEQFVDMEGVKEAFLKLSGIGMNVIEESGENSEDYVINSPLIMFQELTLSEMKKTVHYVESTAKLIKRLKEIEKYYEKKATKTERKSKETTNNEKKGTMDKEPIKNRKKGTMDKEPIKNKKKRTMDKEPIKNKNILNNENQNQQKKINPRNSKAQKPEFHKEESYDPLMFLFIFCVIFSCFLFLVYRKLRRNQMLEHDSSFSEQSMETVETDEHHSEIGSNEHLKFNQCLDENANQHPMEACANVNNFGSSSSANKSDEDRCGSEVDYKTRCWYCDKQVRVFKCEGCRKARYCSKDCIVDDWSTHGPYCIKVQNIRRASEESKKASEEPKKTSEDSKKTSEDSKKTCEEPKKTSEESQT